MARKVLDIYYGFSAEGSYKKIMFGRVAYSRSLRISRHCRGIKEAKRGVELLVIKSILRYRNALKVLIFIQEKPLRKNVKVFKSLELTILFLHYSPHYEYAKRTSPGLY